MSKQVLIGLGLAIVFAGVCSIPAQGRQVPDWPNELLFKTADLVVVAKVQAVEDATDKVADKPDDHYVGVLTTFQVEYVIKGEHKDKELAVYHYRLKEGVHIANGPMLVSFQTKTMSIRYSRGDYPFKPEYMLFLKRRSDSRYECVSGQDDPVFSVKLLVPNPAH
jgi:hypothetical protein